MFAALTAIFAKIGLAGVDSEPATLIRAVVIFGVLGSFVDATGKWSNSFELSGKTWRFLVLSGLATGLPGRRAVRGATVQGLGGTPFEEGLHDTGGTPRKGHIADHRVPMAAEPPDIVVGQVQRPTRNGMLGVNDAKGAADAGTAGAPGAVMNASGDAPASFGMRVASQPITPEHKLRALGRIA